MTDALLRADLKAFILNPYAADDITLNEIAGIILQMEVLPSSALYDGNKAIIKMILDGLIQ